MAPRTLADRQPLCVCCKANGVIEVAEHVDHRGSALHWGKSWLPDVVKGARGQPDQLPPQSSWGWPVAVLAPSIIGYGVIATRNQGRGSLGRKSGVRRRNDLPLIPRSSFGRQSAKWATGKVATLVSFLAVTLSINATFRLQICQHLRGCFGKRHAANPGGGRSSLAPPHWDRSPLSP